MEQMEYGDGQNGGGEGQAGRDNTGDAAPPAKNVKRGQVVGNYVLGRDLGKGTFGEVILG